MRKPLVQKQKATTYNFYRDGVTQSMLQSWKACRQLSAYQLDGWQLPRSPRKAIEFGTMIHKALEHYYESWQGQMLAFSDNLKKFCERYRFEQLSEGQVAPEDIDYNATVCEALLQTYAHYWGEVDADFDWVSQEQTFNVPWGRLKAGSDDPFTYLRGKIDGVLQRKGRLWLFETKTKGQISPDTLSHALAFDFQNLFYITAYEQMTGEEVFGTVYNILRPPQLRISVKKQETPHQFIERVKDDISSRPEHYFYRMEIAYSPRQKEIFRKQLNRQLRDFERWWNAPELKTYRNEGNCTAKWTCEYLPICATGKFSGFERTKKLFSELEDDK